MCLYCRDELKSCLAHCEAVIDFGDDDRENDIDDSDMWVLSPRVQSLCEELKGHLNDNHRGEIIRDGVRVALIGPPNAGECCAVLSVLFTCNDTGKNRNSERDGQFYCSVLSKSTVKVYCFVL
jgi:tRNA U34 5-carboxymethylaminomethyl modifying GTPase MnmE/TrmE